MLLSTEGRRLRWHGRRTMIDRLDQRRFIPLTHRDEAAFDYENMITRWAAQSTTEGGAGA